MSDTFDPYHKWLAIPPEDQPADHYRLLGLKPFENDADVIETAADRQMAHVRSFQSGPHSDLSQKLLNEISSAKVVLLTPEKKAAYDRDLKAKLDAQKPAPKQPGPAKKPLPAGKPLPSAKRKAVPEPSDSGPGSKAASATATQEQSRPAWQQPAVLAGIPAALLVIGGLAYLLSPGGNAEPVDAASVVAQGEQDNTGVEPEEPADTVDRPDKPSADPGDAAAHQRTRNIPPESRPGDDGADAGKTASDPSPSTKPPARDNPDPSKSNPPSSEQPSSEPDTPRTQPGEETDPGGDEPSDSQKPQKPPVPADEQLAQARQELQAAFAAEYAAAKDDTTKAILLASTLLRQAGELEDDGPGGYVLLAEAHDLAAAAGDYALALSAVDKLAERYDIDGLAKKAGVYEQALDSTLPVDQREKLVTEAFGLVDLAVDAERFDVAGQMTALLGDQVRRVRDVELRKRIQSVEDEVDDRRQKWAAAQKAVAALEKDADDPDANLRYGRYLCLVQRDWPRGLAHLAKGGDERLAKLAEQDLASPETPDEQVALADAWLQLAESGPAHADFSSCAHYWYQKALPNLSGVTQLRVARVLKKLGTPSRPRADQVASASEPAPEVPASEEPTEPSPEEPAAEDAAARVATFTAPDQSENLAPLNKGDGVFTIEQAQGKSAIVAERYLYFRVGEAFAYDLPAEENYYAIARVTLLDSSPGRVHVQFDGHATAAEDQEGRWREGFRNQMAGSGQWLELDFMLPEVKFAHRQNYRADLRFSKHKDSLVVHKVELHLIKSSAPRLLEPRGRASLPNQGGVWEFDWSEVEGADAYNLLVMHGGQPAIATTTTEPRYRFGQNKRLAGGECRGWTWKVRAVKDGKATPWSPPRRFEVAAP